jgi:hypothetical protein
LKETPYILEPEEQKGELHTQNIYIYIERERGRGRERERGALK